MDLTKEKFFTDYCFLNSLIIQLTTKQKEEEVNNFDFSLSQQPLCKLFLHLKFVVEPI